MQQRWPWPPHATHWLLLQVLNAAVHSTPPVQQAWPILPQVPDWQPLFVHMPSVPGQAAPLAMQVRLLLSQQPPFAQLLPSQHGWPGPPHAAHLPPLHERPVVVQKRAPEVAF
ncbi:MAG: hypothetical protein U0787_05380 [Polyangia bacterium]